MKLGRNHGTSFLEFIVSVLQSCICLSSCCKSNMKCYSIAFCCKCLTSGGSNSCDVMETLGDGAHLESVCQHVLALKVTLGSQTTSTYCSPSSSPSCSISSPSSPLSFLFPSPVIHHSSVSPSLFP